MADVYTRIGYIKGATGAQGERGLQGDPGDAATIQVGTVTTVPYGQTANVVNSGTEQAAVFDFTIPQGRPGQQTTEMDNLLLNSITTSAASFPIPAVGETGKVLWGKVTKWFSDMAALVASKFDASNVVNNLTTTSSGYALDARQGKALNDSLGLNSFQLLYNNMFYFYFKTTGNIVACNIAYGQSVSLPTSWTTVGQYPYTRGFANLSIPLVDGAVISLRLNNGNVQFRCSTSNAIYPQGSGATIF